jgi:hypothetical protein
VDAGRVPVLLPQSIYPVANREFLLAQTGAELYGRIPLGDAGAAEYRAYGGTIYVPASEASAQLQNFDVPYVVGGRLMWASPLEGLQMGASAQKLRFDFDFAPNAEQLQQYQMQGVLPANFSGTVGRERAYTGLERTHVCRVLRCAWSRARRSTSF